MSLNPLSAHTKDVVPELNHLTALHVDLLHWQTLMLDALAAREHLDTGAYLAREREGVS